MYKLTLFNFAMLILWHISRGQSNLQTTSNNTEEIIRPRFSNFISRIKKVSSVTRRYENESFFTGQSYFDKIREADEITEDDNPENFEWLRNDNKFNRNSTGIIYTGQMDPKDLTRDFCRVLSLHKGRYQEHESAGILLNTISNTGHNTICGSNWQVVLDLRNLDTIPGSLQNLTNTNTILLLSDAFYEPLFEKFRQRIKPFGIQYGYSFNADKLENYLIIINYKFKPYIYDILRDPNSVLYIFYFEETLENIQAGATRMFRKRVVLFEECRNLVLKNRNPNHNTEIGFALTKYYRSKDFYESPRDMQTYVKYIELLSNWTEAMNSTVVFIGTDLDTAEEVETAGWYSRIKNSNQFITKRKQALDLSVAQYTPPIDSKGLSTPNVLLVTILPLVFVILISVMAFYFVRKYYINVRISNDEIHKFLHGNENSTDEFYNAPYDKDRYEIPEGSFTIGEPLDSGEFGRVCRGTITKMDDDEMLVAVKFPNPIKFHRNIVQSLMSEIKVLAYLGKHQNIVELLGANITKLKRGKVFIFLEFCELGSLEKYLRNVLGNRFSGQNMLEAKVYKDMFRWSTEICNGMGYLAEHSVVHADLATRNVLLNQDKVAKLCDFGLSKRMLNYTSCVDSGQELFPWRWMAPESLTGNKFSEKSDAWAFGVTLWEIYSLGDIPYPGLGWDIGFPKKLEEGFRLPEPKYNEKEMYILMKNCWSTKPDERPTFSCISTLLEKWDDGGGKNYATVV